MLGGSTASRAKAMATLATSITTGRVAILRLSLPASQAFCSSRRDIFTISSTAISSSPRLRRPRFGLIVRCFSAPQSDKPRAPARLVQMRRLLEESEAKSGAPIEEVPKICLEHVTVSFARSGGPGGQNVNKLNTKVDMRFNVKEAYWLPEQIREKLMQMEKNRINNEGELVISSTKTRTQKGNIEDALTKLQALIDAAAYVPPPPSEETKKKINKLAKIENERRLDAKKKAAFKKSSRKAGGWD